MQAGDVKRLSAKVRFSAQHSGRRLTSPRLRGNRSPGRASARWRTSTRYTYRTEDIDDYIKSVHMLAFGTYHAVFGKSPLHHCEGQSRRTKRIATAYASCYREYSLSVPFAERIFQAGNPRLTRGRGAGYTGQITANSFMKREFGKKLIEEFFPRLDLTHVIDTSGAYIPGHGTPTVILFGRWQYPRPALHDPCCAGRAWRA